MRTRTVAPGNERISAFGDGGKGIQYGGSVLHAGRIGFRAAKYKIVVQEGEAGGIKAIQGIGIACVHKILLLALGVDQN